MEQFQTINHSHVIHDVYFQCNNNWGKPEQVLVQSGMVCVSSSRKFTEQSDLPHTVAERIRTSHSQKYTERIWFAPHYCRIVRTLQTQKFTERIRLLLNGTYPTNMKCSTLQLHVAMCAAMSETQGRLQKRKEHLQAIRLQPDGHLGHLL